MKADKHQDLATQAPVPSKPRKRVAIVGPDMPGRCRLLPLDSQSVNAVFVSHDRFRDFLRST